MTYEILWDPRAEKKFKKLPKVGRSKMRQAIEALSKDPRPHQVKKMTGAYDGFYRIPVGRNYRVVYTINDINQSIVIEKVGSREEIY